MIRVLIAAVGEHGHPVVVGIGEGWSRKLLTDIDAILGKAGAVRGRDWSLSVETDGTDVKLSFGLTSARMAELLRMAVYRFVDANRERPPLTLAGIVSGRFRPTLHLGSPRSPSLAKASRTVAEALRLDRNDTLRFTMND